MSWVCENCGNEITEEELQELIEDQEENLEDVSAVILVDCDSCEEELATYENDDIIDGSPTQTEPQNTSDTRSKMLQLARKGSNQSEQTTT